MQAFALEKFRAICVGQRGLPLASPISSGQVNWMMYFSVYLDESGKVHNADYTAYCGYLADPGVWADFTVQWDRLRLRMGVPPIHTSRIMRNWTKGPDKKRDGWYEVYLKIVKGGIEWDGWRDSMLMEFARLILDSAIVCVGAAVDAKAYKAIRQSDSCRLGQKDTNVFCLQECIWMAMEKIMVVDKHPSITLILDDDKENAYDYYQNFKVLRTVWDQREVLGGNPTQRFEMMRDCVHTISYGQDNAVPALQAADMISYQASRFKKQQRVGEDIQPDDLYAFLTMGGLHQPKYYDEKVLRLLGHNNSQALERLRQRENCEGL